MTTYASNRYCVEKLLVLSERHAVVAAQDIYDEQGLKLLAKGAHVSRDLQDRLLMRKLKAPLEASLTVHEGITFTELMQGALDLIDENPALQRIAGSRAARDILREARGLHIPPPLSLLMTCARETDVDSHRRTRVVSAICAGIAAGLDAGQSDTQAVLIAAALHDLGEIYVNPEYLHPRRVLSPREWKHMASHPQVGQILIRGLTSLPSSVGACVGQHHERHDGSGYPAQLTRREQHPLAGWIAIADAAAAIMGYPHDVGERISLALRIVPEEFDRQASDILIRALHGMPGDGRRRGSAECMQRAKTLDGRLLATIDELREVGGATTNSDLRHLCGKAVNLLHGFVKSLRATGILDTEALSGDDIGDQQLLAEMQQIVAEITWRMRNLARNLFMNVDSWKDDEALRQLQRSIDLLHAETGDHECLLEAEVEMLA